MEHKAMIKKINFFKIRLELDFWRWFERKKRFVRVFRSFRGVWLTSTE